mmetsp:Transcript_23579/g.58572  ORF Transcript_23579/g.58572 Transcript_23579/m.58572 type:complete len:81 (+) Transcript_23579:618-860(+)
MGFKEYLHTAIRFYNGVVSFPTADEKKALLAFLGVAGSGDRIEERAKFFLRCRGTESQLYKGSDLAQIVDHIQTQSGLGK